MGGSTDSDRVIAGRYRLIEPLGSGGMGTVWLAHDELLCRRVAVKEVFPPPGLSDSEREMLRERTLREARTAARLSHPNVVTIFDVAEDDGRPWIVMELIQARSLGELVDENGPLDVRAVARVGLQLLAALRSAHAIGIMHRDVKPGNVLMDADGRAILADFGIARAEDSPATTTSGVLVGSPSYIAPERAQGGRGGPASDLWSLGATLYAAIEGRPPYDRGGALPTLMAVVSEDPDAPRRAGIMWPVIRGLLAADPSRRLSYAAADQMLRQVAESNVATATVPMPTADQLPGFDVTGVGHGNPPDTLKRAGRTRAFHPRASPGPEPEPQSESLQPSEPSQPPASPQPPEPPQPLRLNAPAEPAAAWPPEVPVPSRAETDQDMAVTPRTGFPVLPDSFPAEAQASAAPAQPAASPRASVATAAQPTEDADKNEDPADEPVLVSAGADDAPAPTTPVRPPAPGRWDNGAREPRRRHIRLLASAVALVAAAGVALGLYVANRPAAGLSASGEPGHSISVPARSQAAAPGTSRARTQSATPTSPQSRSTPPTAKTPARPKFGDQAIVPAGYHTYRDPTGFSIAMPNGWNVSHQGHHVYLTPPSGTSFLLIDQSGHPKSNPLADWHQQEANRRATYVGYHRIRLVAIHYPQAEKAADWEFTYYRSSVLTHVLNRNILANAQHAYALYWSTPESEWSSEYSIFAVLARTFQPADGPAS